MGSGLRWHIGPTTRHCTLLHHVHAMHCTTHNTTTTLSPGYPLVCICWCNVVLLHPNSLHVTMSVSLSRSQDLPDGPDH